MEVTVVPNNISTSAVKELLPSAIIDEPHPVTMSPSPPTSSHSRRSRCGPCVELCLVGGVAIKTGPFICSTCGSGCIGCLASFCVCQLNYVVGALWGFLSCVGRCWGPARAVRAERVRYFGKVLGYTNNGETKVFTVNGKAITGEGC